MDEVATDRGGRALVEAARRSTADILPRERANVSSDSVGGGAAGLDARAAAPGIPQAQVRQERAHGVGRPRAGGGGDQRRVEQLALGRKRGDFVDDGGERGWFGTSREGVGCHTSGLRSKQRKR